MTEEVIEAKKEIYKVLRKVYLDLESAIRGHRQKDYRRADHLTRLTISDSENIPKILRNIFSKYLLDQEK